MCIIVSKEKGVEMPSKEVLMNCFEANSDGAGLMYADKGVVRILKGFMEFDTFWLTIEKLGRKYDLKELPLVMHFRISTSGLVDGGNCHPYPVCNDEKLLRSRSVTTDLGMAHNGIIYDYAPKDNKWTKQKSKLNDTQNFVKTFVSVLKDLNKDFLSNIDVLEMLDKTASSKLCFMDKDGNITYVGDFTEDKGVKYSNTSYLERVYYPKAYSDYDDGYYSHGGYQIIHWQDEDGVKTTYDIDEIMENIFEGANLSSQEIEMVELSFDPLLSDEMVQYDSFTTGMEEIFTVPKDNTETDIRYYVGDFGELFSINKVTGEAIMLGNNACSGL